jgi:hypothetical protein
MVKRSPSETDVLARRVRYLDRYRHLAALAITLLATPHAIARFSTAVDLDWRVIQVLLGLAVGVVLWAVVEVVLASIAATWEIKLERLVAHEWDPARRLPRARLVSGDTGTRLVRTVRDASHREVPAALPMHEPPR